MTEEVPATGGGKVKTREESEIGENRVRGGTVDETEAIEVVGGAEETLQGQESTSGRVEVGVQ